MQKKTTSKRGSPKSVLRLPDLDHSKAFVLQILGSPASKRTTALQSMTSFVGTAQNLA